MQIISPDNVSNLKFFSEEYLLKAFIEILKPNEKEENHPYLF